MSNVKKLVCLAPADSIQLAVHTGPMPSPKHGQVIVRVEATSVNPIDVKRAHGYGQRLLRLKGAGTFPLVLGNDLVGIVETVGEGSQWSRGDRVMGVLPTGKAGGAHASHVVVDSGLLRPAPNVLSSEALAVYPYTFTTLWLALRNAGITQANAKTLSVLIHGASGGLGQLALQVLKAWGASVTAICSSPNVDLCKSLGANLVWDRTRQPLKDLPAHFDAGLNFGAWQDEETLLGKLKLSALGYATAVHPLLANFDRHGLLLGALKSRQDWKRMRRLAASKGASYRWVIFRPDAEALDVLSQFLSQGTLNLGVGISVPLQDSKSAFDYVSGKLPGKAVILP